MKQDKIIGVRHRFQNGKLSGGSTWEDLTASQEKIAFESMEQVSQIFKDPALLPKGSFGWVYMPFSGSEKSFQYFVKSTEA